MFKKNFAVILLLILVTSCGYQPIFSSKGSNFSIAKITIQENNKIDLNIKKNLKIYQNQKNKNKFYDLIIKSKSTKSIMAKDNKGDPKILSINLSVYLEIIENNKIKSKKSFSESFSYDNGTNKFELSKYEKQIEKNLKKKIVEKIIIHLHSI